MVVVAAAEMVVGEVTTYCLAVIGPEKVGEFDKTTLPVPVELVTPVPPLATATIPDILLAFTVDEALVHVGIPFAFAVNT
jgi:hypothetical protein